MHLKASTPNIYNANQEISSVHILLKWLNSVKKNARKHHEVTPVRRTAVATVS